MTINEYLQMNKSFKRYGEYSMKRLSPKVECADGFTMSVQASKSHYCSPRKDDVPEYESVEIGYPNQAEELIFEYAESNGYTETVYGFVPVGLVDQVIEKHGGFKAIQPNLEYERL